MKCPICTVDLVMTDRQGVEIDYCPKCRGVWLDRGEIDKIIERSATLEAKAVPPPAPQPAPQPAGFAPPPQPAYAPPQTGYAPPPQPGWAPQQGHWKRDDDDDRYRKHGHPYGKKRKSFLSDLLDFD